MGIRVGIDLGGTNIKVGLVDENYKVVLRKSVPTGKDLSFDTVMDRIRDVVVETLAGATPEAIGIGVPTAVLNRRIAVHTPNMDWRNCDVAKGMEERFPNVSCAVGNDADCAALGESLAGAGRDYSSMVLLTLGTGVGGSVVYNGKVLLGDAGCGVEIGHMKIQIGGELCGCGNRGCIEAYASATALRRDIRCVINSGKETVMRKWLDEGEKLDAKLMFDAVKEGDAVGKALFDNYVRNLSVALSNCVLLYRPQILVLGGGISAAGDILFDALNAAIPEITYGAELQGCPKVIPAQLGNTAGIIGAAYI